MARTSLKSMRLSYSHERLAGEGDALAFLALLQQPLPVRVISKDGFPPVAPIHHMVNRPRVLDALLARHQPKWIQPRPRESL